LIIYAVGENLIERGFGFCLRGAWEFDKWRDSFIVVIANSLCTCGVSSVHQKGTCLVRSSSAMMMITISKQRLPDVRKRGKTFINHEHLLNRSSALLTRLLSSPAKSVNGNCVMNYER
jgi:hypothetical protein